MPLFPEFSWPDFTIGGEVYSFGHLSEFTFAVEDSGGSQRSVLVTYTDHVFTRRANPADAEHDAFPNCSRSPAGYLCPVRYSLSKELPGLLPKVAQQKVWNLTGGDRYAQVPVITHEGKRALYAIIFTLDKLKGMRLDLRLHVRSAHICEVKPPDTFGEVRFPHLVSLRLKSQHPPRVYSGGRKKPKMP